MRQVLITKVHDAPTRPLSQNRGLAYRLADPEVCGTEHLDVHLNELLPDTPAGPLHYHDRSENFILVLDGVVEIMAEDQFYILERDSVAFLAPGIRHFVRNAGATVARLLEVYAPPGPDFHIVRS
ncbi:MAG TPA: cupin domain-containing protein [Thermoleophilia bacterium]|nr:cupin domain-containing protein [Thermoleophilia bacterium]